MRAEPRPRSTPLRLPVLPVLIAAAVAIGGARPDPLVGQATAYVPSLDVAYDDLDALRAVGLVRSVIAGQRPYSRLAMARAAVEAREALDARDARPPVRFVEALERLEARFAPELLRLRGEDPVGGPGVSARSAELAGTWSDSPGREAFTPYEYADYIDASVNPLLQRNEGRDLADGWTLAAEGVVDVTLGDGLVGQLRPRGLVRDDPGGGTEADGTLVGGYARAVFGSFAVDLGRLPVSHGHGVDGGAALSHNARGLDMVRISSDRPVRLPWILDALGPFAFSGFVAHMGNDRDTPGSALIASETSIRPHPNLELGLVTLNHQGGAGAPDASFGERVQDILFIRPQGEPISDKVIAGDVRLTLPSLTTELYTELSITDSNDIFANPGEPFGTEAIWIWGGRVRGLGGEGRFDVWAEGRRAGVRPHTHHQFSSGMTVDDRVLGDPLGPLADGVFVGADWRGPGQVVGVSLAWEQYRSDMYLNVEEDDCFCWEKVEDGPDERRLRVSADWRPDPRPGGVAVAVRLGYERVRGFAFGDEDRSNLLGRIGLEYHW